MGAADKWYLLQILVSKGWTVTDAERNFARPPDSFWDSMKGREFHVYHARLINDMLATTEEDVIDTDE